MARIARETRITPARQTAMMAFAVHPLRIVAPAPGPRSCCLRRRQSLGHVLPGEAHRDGREGVGNYPRERQDELTIVADAMAALSASTWWP